MEFIAGMLIGGGLVIAGMLIKGFETRPLSELGKADYYEEIRTYKNEEEDKSDDNT